MKLSNKILAVLLAMTLITSQGLAWDDEQKQDENSKRKYVTAGLVTAGVVIAGVLGFKAWKHFDLGSLFKRKSSVDAEEYVGIDLGTTKSGGGRGDELIPDAEGRTMTASAVAYDKDGKVISTGNEALDEEIRVTSAKRVIGMPERIAKEEKNFKVVADKDRKGMEHMAAIETAAGKVSPEEVATEVLKGIKQRIKDAHQGKDFKKAVITVPAYFYEFQKAATKRAAKAAGFEEVVLINEPTAAAFAHGAAELDMKDFKRGVSYLVYDFGGGTMDISIVKATLTKTGFMRKQKTFKVESITGDPRLGGDDIDAMIAKKFAEDLGLDFKSADDTTKRVLRQQAEEAKIHLSDANNEAYSREFELSGQDMQVEISRKDFDTEIEKIVDRTIELAKDSIKLAKNIELNDIDEVVLVGGSSRNLLVRQKLIDVFGEDRLAKSLQGDIDPDEMVAIGAAKYAKKLDTNNDYKLSDIVPMALRVDLTNRNTGKTEAFVAINRFDNQPASGSVGAEITSNTDELNLYIRQGDSDGNYKENLAIGKPKFEGKFSEKENVEIVFDINNDGVLELKIVKEDGTEVPASIDMSKTPEDIDEMGEGLTHEQLFQHLFEGMFSKEEFMEVFQEMRTELKEELVKIFQERLAEFKEDFAKELQEMFEKFITKNAEAN